MGTRAEATDPESRLRAWERRTDVPLTVLSAGFLLVYTLEVLATRPGTAAWHGLETALWILWAVFAVDVAVRLVLARNRWRFVLNNPLDLLVVLAPFLRFLRLVRLVGAVSVLTRTLRDDLRGRVSTYLIVTVSLLSFVAALGVYEAERDAPEATITSFGDALWWVLTTITTVGYGDRYPVTPEGRLIAAGLMLAGIAVLGTVTATIATWFTDQIDVARGQRADAAAGPPRWARRRTLPAPPTRRPGTPCSTSCGCCAPGSTSWRYRPARTPERGAPPARGAGSGPLAPSTP